MKKRLMLALLLVCALVMTACNYPSSHSNVEASEPGSGVLHIDYTVNSQADGQQEAFNSAVSYQLVPNGAKLYIYRVGEYNSADGLGANSVKTLEASEALSFLYTGPSAYRLSIAYSGLEDGDYEVRWYDDFSSGEGPYFYFHALDAEGETIYYEGARRTNRFCSYDHYQITIEGEEDASEDDYDGISFRVGEGAPATPTPTPTPDPETEPTPTPTPVPGTEPTPTPSNEPSTTPAPPDGNAAVPPSTGDSAQPMLWICLMVLCAAGIVIVLRQRVRG